MTSLRPLTSFDAPIPTRQLPFYLVLRTMIDDAPMSRIKNIKALLIDLNGTIHVGHEPTPRAVEAIAKLRNARVPFIFCSNNTKECTADVVDRLKRMGIPVKLDEVTTSIGACRQVVDERKLKPYLILSPSAKAEFSHLPECVPEEYDSVILGQHPPSLSYESLNIAFRILKREPLSEKHSPPKTAPVLIAPHTASFLQSPATSDLPAGLSLGIGPFVKALESATGVQAEIVGKPTRQYFEMAVERMRGLYPAFTGDVSDCAVVGDDIENDLGAGAMELGMTRILGTSAMGMELIAVRSGKYRPGAEDVASPPDGIFDNFADFVDALI